MRSRTVYREPKAPLEHHVIDLLSRMTLEEKVVPLRCMWTTKQTFDEHGEFSPEKAREFITDGIGQLARPSERGLSDLLQNFYGTIEDTQLRV